MGITYGDHLIDSGYQDITPEQERESEAREECKRRGLDPDEICADGGVTTWMVVDRERYLVETKVCHHDCYRPGDCDGSCTHPSPPPDPSGLEALVERVRETVEQMAGSGMSLSLAQWDTASNTFLEAADALTALKAERDEARRETEDLWKARHAWFNATVNALRSARVNLDRAETAERARKEGGE